MIFLYFKVDFSLLSVRLLFILRMIFSCKRKAAMVLSVRAILRKTDLGFYYLLSVRAILSF